MTTTELDAQAGRTTDGPPRPAVVLTEVSKVYGRGPQACLAVDRLSLEVRAGEFVCLVGASGCGKSTLLSMISGLEPVSGGSITIDGGHRPALMFQESALFPWLTVRGNVELALRLRGVSRSDREPEARELLASVHLADFADKRPHELSGGMRQRVALARTLAQRTPVLLMDEPFGALDAMTRDMLHDEIERICRERALTVVFVTHNVREAARLGDRIVLLSSRPGRVVAEYPVDIPRPRRIDSPEIATLSATVTDRLREEVRRHGH
ncbi:MAG TPA: ABC transporter ATP-binding protein [Actinotalea sp.]|nr:ABC transporter ATP-binding protein [Actinotalea sp.]